MERATLTGLYKLMTCFRLTSFLVHQSHLIYQLNLLTGGYMFEISNVDGLDVRMYSAIPDEDEIVLKYTAMYKG